MNKLQSQCNNMEINIIQVGNSKGLRIPKSILDEYKINDKVELKLKEGYIEVRPINKPRKGWENKFEEMLTDKNEEQRIDDFFEDEDI